jgi:hypothetical protein
MLFRTIPWKKNQLGTKRGSVRAARTRRIGLINTPQGALRGPPAHRSFLFILKNTKLTTVFPETKCFPLGPNSGHQGCISFHRTTKTLMYNIPRHTPHPSHPSKLRCILLMYTFEVQTNHFVKLFGGCFVKLIFPRNSIPFRSELRNWLFRGTRNASE